MCISSWDQLYQQQGNPRAAETAFRHALLIEAHTIAGHASSWQSCMRVLTGREKPCKSFQTSP